MILQLNQNEKFNSSKILDSFLDERLGDDNLFEFLKKYAKTFKSIFNEYKI